MTQSMARIFNMKTYKNLYPKIISLENLFLSYKKARKGKTKKHYIIKFEKNLKKNLFQLQKELLEQTYSPLLLKTFILRDPKTRKISKSAFRDRIVHHAIINIIEPIFDKTFIYDSYANRIGKGTLSALKRFDKFERKIINNLKTEAFCLKADIKHYFQEINHEILMKTIKRKISDKKVIWLIKQILNNVLEGEELKMENKGMPLGNLASQFFANLYLNPLDYFAKHKLRAKYYIRYVDDFVILNNSKKQLEIWKKKINEFLENKLKIKLHADKSRIISLSRGMDFVGFRNFYYFKLLRKRNVKSIFCKVDEYKKGKICKGKLLEIFQGWNAYAKWADSYGLRRGVVQKIYNPLN